MDRTAWIETDLRAIRHNIVEIKRWIGPRAEIMAVVKANAYGHGLEEVAKAAVEAGAAMLAVALPSEAAALRRARLTCPILALSCVLPEECDLLVDLGVSQVVSLPEVVGALSAAAQRYRKPARVHVKVDTGMGRVGVACQDAVSFVERTLEYPGIELEGVLTHFAAADEPEDLSFAYTQLERFQGVLAALRRKGIEPRWRHAANSAAIVSVRESLLDIVRPGLLVYGIPPTRDIPCPLELKPALSLKARITQLRSAAPGQCVSYGRTFVVQQPSKLAIVPLGYADGFCRAHSNRGKVLIRGKSVPIVGRVCMDQFVVDVTTLPHVSLGDPVVLIGQQEDQSITVWDVATSMDSIAHEVVSALGPRLPRIFLQ